MREAPVGFSWTVLFFGWFPPMFRSDWKWAVIMFICTIVTFGLSGLVFMFIYNKIYIKELLNNGYKVKSIENGAKDKKGNPMTRIITHEIRLTKGVYVIDRPAK